MCVAIELAGACLDSEHGSPVYHDSLDRRDGAMTEVSERKGVNVSVLIQKFPLSLAPGLIPGQAYLGDSQLFKLNI
jgi:hypothetical protein